MKNFFYANQNKNAVIDSRTDKSGKIRTETQRRDPGTVNMAISTDAHVDSTNLFIDFAPGDYINLSGREARTLYRLLQKHYRATGKARRR